MLNEYRIKPVTRYVLTHYQSAESGTGSVSTVGEYDNYQAAEKVYNAFTYNPAAHSQKYIVVLKNDWLYDKQELPDIRIWYADTYEDAVSRKEDLESKFEYEWVLAELKT